MPKAATAPKAKKDKTASGANLGFEAKLWLTADKLRNNMDAAEYKHVVLGLIFLKYISDAFEELHAKLLAGEGDNAGADPEAEDHLEDRGPDGLCMPGSPPAEQPDHGSDDTAAQIDQDPARVAELEQAVAYPAPNERTLNQA